jgi:hypothetical protein
MKPELLGKDNGQAPRAKTDKSGKVTGTTLRMIFLGANPDTRVTGQAELPGKANYFIGNDPAKWRTNVPTYASVYYQDLYTNIDLVYYGKPAAIRVRLRRAARADPRLIALGIQGADKLEVDAQGDLVLHTPGGAFRQRRPLIYQEVDGRRREIAGGYVLEAPDRVVFQVAAYDRSRPLVIDPVLFYSTYLGGTGGDQGSSIVVDTAGSAYVTGTTSSIDFPTTLGGFQTAYSGGASDVFVTKLNPTGSGLVYSTYLGGSGAEDARSAGQIAIDAAGNAYVAGATSSLDFPTTPVPSSPRSAAPAATASRRSWTPAAPPCFTPPTWAAVATMEPSASLWTRPVAPTWWAPPVRPTSRRPRGPSRPRGSTFRKVL